MGNVMSTESNADEIVPLGAYKAVGARLVEQGYRALRVPRGLKHPNIKDWLLTYSHRKPTQKEIDEWSASGAGVGIVTGPASSDVVGVDIDTDDPAIITAIMFVLPSNGTIVKKRGQKGFTIFGRGPGLKDKAFNINSERVCDLLANGRFCVLPGTIHPDTNEPYRWLTPDTLENTDPSELPELPPDIIDQLAGALVPFGYEVQPERPPLGRGTVGDAEGPWRQVNEQALANLSGWVPALNLFRYRRTHTGFEAVATWRASSTGRPEAQRKFNLKIDPKGIRDFGADQGYTAIDLVMAALDCDFNTAFVFLDERLNPSDVIIDLKPKPLRGAEGKSSMTHENLDEAEAAAGEGQRAVMYASGAYGVVVATAEAKATAEIIALFPVVRRKPDQDDPPMVDDAGDNPKQNRTGPVFSWDKPDRHYLGTGRSAPPDFPLDVLPDFWAEWCAAHSKARYTPLDYTACTLLAGAAGLILNRRWAQPGPEWREPTILWMGTLGDPSDGKTPAMQPVIDLINAIERAAEEFTQPEWNAYQEKLERSKEARKTWEANAKPMRAAGEEPPPMPPEANPPAEVIMPRLLVTDATSEALQRLLTKHPNGLIQYRDELAGWLGNMNRYAGGEGGDRQFWIEAYQGGHYTIDRIKHIVGMSIQHLSVGVIGGIQPDRLAELLKSANDGFVSRFLWTWPNVVPGFSIVRTGVDGTRQLSALKRIFYLEMGEYTGHPVLIPYSPNAQQIFEAFVARNKARRSFGRVKESIGKGGGHAARLSMVLSLLDWSHRELEPEPTLVAEKYVAAAIKLVETYFYPMAERAFQEAALPEVDVSARKLAQWICKAGLRTLNARDVRRAIGGALKESNVMEAACECLVTAHLIRPAGVRAGGTAGRKSKDFEANPKIWELEASEESAA
jgi:Protein of unknown function (DUF3987)/Bifunctional DNA primase/polymerase, N-terminal